ncbi:MAG: hypothetical protein K2I70_03930 [Bacilli bacterium]|nr:hypothetical protein [Bacilli bacterium]
MQRQNMIFIFFVAFLLIIFMGYLFVIGEQKDTRVSQRSTTTTGTIKEDLGECSFAKRYNLLLVTDSDDKEYVFLTLKEFQVDEVKTVKVKRNVMPSLKKGNYYRFSFSTKKKIHDHIDEIFSSSFLMDVEDKGKEVGEETAICETHLIEN